MHGNMNVKLSIHFKQHDMKVNEGVEA